MKLRQLKSLFGDERGMALIMALGILTVLSVTGTTIAYYSTSNANSSNYQKRSQSAYALAEAGVNDALSVLSSAFQPATPTALPQCPTWSATKTLAGGSYQYCGTLNGSIWTIQGKGWLTNTSVKGSNVQRIIKRSVSIWGINSGATISAWSRIYQDSTSSCFTVTSGVVIPANVAARGNLCLAGGQVTGSSTQVAVGGNVTSSASNAPYEMAHANYEVSTSGAPWSNLYYATESDGYYATATVNTTTTTATLDVKDLGFTIPSDATIAGITVKVERGATAGNVIKDQTVQLLKAGAPPNGVSNKAGASYWGTGDSTITYGTTTDLWGAGWTPSDINDSGFGFRFTAYCTPCSAGGTTVKIDHMEVNVYYSESGSYSQGPSIGGNGSGGAGQVTQLDVGGTCQWLTNPTHQPCTSGDRAYSLAYSTLPTGLSKPTVDFNYWYNNAAPGPKHGCDVSSGTPPVFDNNTTYDDSNSDQWLAPDAGAKDSPGATGGGTIGASTSYTCIAKDAGGNRIGELSWNNVTRVLTIYGTIFFDGTAFFHNHNGYIVHYQGRGTIYMADTWHNDEEVCAGGSGLTHCATTSQMSNWDPTQNLMVLIVGDKTAAGSENCNMHTGYSAFQGVIWAKNYCKFTGDANGGAMMSGPVIADVVSIPAPGGGDVPHFFPWPVLGTLLPGQVYGSTSTSPDFIVSPGQASG